MSSANVWVVIKIKMENSLCTQKCVECQQGVGARADMSEALFEQLQGSIVSVSFVVLWVLDCCALDVYFF